MYYREFKIHDAVFSRKSPHICIKPTMGDRKERLKKSLGIPEYPWSTDDDEEDVDPPVNRPSSSVQITEMLQRRFTNPPLPSMSAPDVITASGQSTLRRKAATANDRSLFWEFLSNQRTPEVGPSRNSVLTRLRTSESERRESARAHSGRYQEPPSRRHSPLQEIRGIMALKRATRNLNRHGTAGGAYNNSFISVPGGTLQRNSNLCTAECPTGQRLRVEEYRARGFNSADRPRMGQHSSRADDAQPSTSSGVTRPPRFLYYEEMVAAARASQQATRPDTNATEDSLDDDEAPNQQNDNNDEGDQAVVVDSSPNVSTRMSLEDVLEIEPAQEAIDEQAENQQQATDNVQNTEAQHENNQGPSQPAPSETQATEEMIVDVTTVDLGHAINNKTTGKAVNTVDINKSLLRLLECPVCMECMEPPMSQCRRGHLVCVSCRARLSACPVCRAAFSSVRNRAMEGVSEVVRYPCRHNCGREMRLRRRNAHEASCAHRKYPCPAPACHGKLAVPKHELQQHLQTKHVEILREGRKQRFAVKLNDNLRENYVILAFEEMFHLRINVDVRSWDLTLFVAFIGPKHACKSYVYEVSVAGKYHGRKICYSRSAHNDSDSASNNVNRKDCFYMTLDQATNFLGLKKDNFNALGITVKISTDKVVMEKDDSDESGDS